MQRKTKHRPITLTDDQIKSILNGEKTQFVRRAACNESTGKIRKGPGYLDLTDPNVLTACPYGQIGDELWVKESFLRLSNGGICYRSDFDFQMNNHIVRGTRQRWCPANMMTKKQSRLTLKIEKVQLKRIQEMSQEDLILNDRNLSENAFKAQ